MIAPNLLAHSPLRKSPQFNSCLKLTPRTDPSQTSPLQANSGVYLRVFNTGLRHRSWLRQPALLTQVLGFQFTNVFTNRNSPMKELLSFYSPLVIHYLLFHVAAINFDNLIRCIRCLHDCYGRRRGSNHWIAPAHHCSVCQLGEFVLHY